MTTVTGGNTTEKLGNKAIQPMKKLVSSLDPAFASAMSPTAANVKQHKADAWTRTSSSGVNNALTTYQPELERFWVRAPTTRESTVNSRREWFRVMHINAMADSFSMHECHKGSIYEKTKPITDVKCKIPKSKLKRGRFGEEVPEWGETEYPADLSYMRWDSRFKRMMEEILYYDPDIITMNELSRADFQGDMWRATRLAGYGGTFVSGQRSFNKTLNMGEWYEHAGYEDKIPWEHDLGNAIFFHKGRFFANWAPGAELSKLPFANMTGLKDRSTACQMLTCAVSLTAGAGKDKVAKREFEVRQLLKVLEITLKESTESDSQCLYIAGDFNVEQEDEPCVTMLRERMASAYDVCGGPRWTTWHHQEPPKPKDHPPQAAEKGKSASDAEPTSPAAEQTAAPEKGAVEQTTSAVAPQAPIESEVTSFEEERALLLARGIHKRTTDFMLYNPNRCSVLQALDIPADNLIPQETLLPHPKHPFHHMHLVADLCWNDFAPPKYKMGE